RKQVMDDRELRYYTPPRLDPPPSLYDGFERQVRRDATKNEHIDGLLGALTHLRAQRRPEAVRDAQADFVMYRGMLTQLFVTPYNLRNAWSMNATRVGSTIYIEENVTPEKIASRAGSDEQHQRMMYGGYRFETLCMVDAAPETLAPDELVARQCAAADTVVNTNSEYCSVFRTRLGEHSIIAGAEVDCIDRAKPAEMPNRYCELKTSRVLDTERARGTFERFKLMNIWAQSFIAGIPTVTVGFRDDNGILRSTQDLKTRDIPGLVRGKHRMWEASVCMNFADHALRMIKSHVCEEGPEAQYRIAFDPESCQVCVDYLGKCQPFLTPDYLAAVAAQPTVPVSGTSAT
ncbi:decapping endonuclease targeting mRNA, partial [Coemansia spiralis]